MLTGTVASLMSIAAVALTSGVLIFCQYLKMAKNKKRAAYKKKAMRVNGNRIAEGLRGAELDWFLAMENSHNLNFSWLMRLCDAEWVTLSKDEIVMNMTVTPFVCRKDPSGAYLSVGPLAGMLDEISGFGAAWADQYHRFGPSISLKVEMLKTICPGDRITILSRTIKQGKTLGFIEMKVYMRDGTLAAVGRQLKYMPPPFAWFQRMYWRTFGLLVWPKKIGGEKDVQIESGKTMFDYVPLKDVVNMSESPDEQLDQGLTRTGTQLTWDESGVVVTEAAFEVNHHAKNALGTMAGGCVATVAESAILENSDDAAGRRVGYLELDFMSAVRKRAKVVVKSAHGDTRVVRVMGGGEGDKEGQLVCEVHTRWAEPESFNSSS